MPDPRLEELAQIYRPKKITPAEIGFRDLAGGGGARELERRALTTMREVNALCQIVRGFDNPMLAELAAPRRELIDLQTEILLADLELVERRLERLLKEGGHTRETSLLQRVGEHLEAEEPLPLRQLKLSGLELRALAGFQFLSLKPMMLLLNVHESAVDGSPDAEFAAEAERRQLGITIVSAQIEMEIARMPIDEQKEFCIALGLKEPARDRFVRSVFELVDLLTMFTVGRGECRAWPVPRGIRMQQAAGKIHSDMERGFIRAEVIPVEKFLQLGSEAGCREAGCLRVEGRDYVVQDGDMVNVRFNV